MPEGGTVRLVQVLDYEGKEFSQGDIGQMECCFQVDDLYSTVAELEAKN